LERERYQLEKMKNMMIFSGIFTHAAWGGWNHADEPSRLGEKARLFAAIRQ
jgi:hypothetical protein